MKEISKYQIGTKMVILTTRKDMEENKKEKL
jgi:hypothetical protein